MRRRREELKFVAQNYQSLQALLTSCPPSAIPLRYVKSSSKVKKLIDQLREEIFLQKASDADFDQAIKESKELMEEASSYVLDKRSYLPK